MKIALIGCGGFARVHAEAIRKYSGPKCIIVAVSRDIKHAREYAPILGAVQVIAPYEAAFDDSSIDAVCILTPHNTHIPLAVRAIESGKDVYLEKPAARTVAEAEPLGRILAKHPERVLMVGENFHYITQITSAVKTLKDGEIGQLQMIIMNHLYFNEAGSWRSKRELMGGGALIDGGIHYMHSLRMLGGEFASVCAVEPKTKTSRIEGESCLQLLIKFQSGATGIATYSWEYNANPPAPSFILLGTKGTLKIYLDRQENELFKKSNEEPIRLSTIPNTGAVDSMERALSAFIDAIKDRHSPEVTLAEGLRDVAIVEAAYRSLASGSVEPVRPLPNWAHITFKKE